MYLFINNLKQKRTVLGLKRGKKTFWRDYSNRNEKIILSIDDFLKKQGKTLKEMKGIVAVNGPGSFSGIRSALSVSNALAWVLKIPVIGVDLTPEAEDEDLFEKGIKELLKKKKRKPAAPFYGKEPNITLAGQVDKNQHKGKLKMRTNKQ